MSLLKWKSLIYSVLFCLRLRLLQNVDWSNKIKCRILLASLVQGTKMLACERGQGSYQGGERPESKWIKFGFELHDSPLVDKDGKIYGAIFKNNYPYHSNKSGFNSPKFIFAFRGTTNKPPFIKDLTQALKFLCHRFLKSSRVQDALPNVLKVIDLAGGPENVWLVGHSLGAAISLAVGTELVVKHEYLLKTFLFNPINPVTSSSQFGIIKFIDVFITKFVKTFPLNTVTDSSQFGFSKFVDHFKKKILTPSSLEFINHQKASQERFVKLSHSTWTPHLFINKSDPICNGYVSDFEDRNKMGASTTTTTIFPSVRDSLLSGIRGATQTQELIINLIAKGLGRDWEPIHVIPWAHLTITEDSDFSPWKAHQIKRWLEKDLRCRTVTYRPINEASPSNLASQKIIAQLHREKEALEERMKKQEAEMAAMKEVVAQQAYANEEMMRIMVQLMSGTTSSGVFPTNPSPQ